MTKKEIIKNKKTIMIIPRGFIYLMAFAVFSVCAILVPEIGREERLSNPNAGTFWPFLLGMWILSLPIFSALFEAHKILNYIDEGKAFSTLTIRAIQNIKKYSITFGVLIILSALGLIVAAQVFYPSEDTPPVGLIGFLITFVSIVIATFAATLEKLLKEALNLKEENELTI